MSFGPPPPPSAWTHSAMTQISRRKRKRSRIFGIVAAMTVIVAASLASVSFILLRSDDDPAGGHQDTQPVRQLPGDVKETTEKVPTDLIGTEVFSHEFDETAEGGFSASYQTWLTDKHLVRARIDGQEAYLKGYKIDRKKEVQGWKIPLGAGLCGTTSQMTVDGRTALITEIPGTDGKLRCGRLVIVDLNRGKILWSKDIPNPVATATDTWGVVLSQNVAAVSWSDGTVAYDLTARKLLWSDSQASKCEVRGFAGGSRLLAVVECTVSGTDRKDLKVAEVDPETGKRIWTYSPGSFGHVALNVVSTQPAVIAVYTEIGTPSHLISIDEQGKRRTTIPLATDIHKVDCPLDILNGQRVDDCRGVVISENYAFVDLAGKLSNTEPRNGVAVYDLQTGKGVTRFDSDLFHTLSVFQSNGEHALAVEEGTSNRPSAVYELRVKGKKKVLFMAFTAFESLDPETEQLRYTAGSLAVGHPYIEKGRVGEQVFAPPLNLPE